MTDRVTLEEAGRLKKAGFEQEECEKAWQIYEDEKNWGKPKLVENDGRPSPLYERIACPCACEILAKLPAYYEDFALIINKDTEEYGAGYRDDEYGFFDDYVSVNKSLVSACVCLFEWLAAEGLLPKEDGK